MIKHSSGTSTTGGGGIPPTAGSTPKPRESLEARLAAAVEQARDDAFEMMRDARALWLSRGIGVLEKSNTTALDRYGDLRAAEGRWKEHVHAHDCAYDCEALADVQALLAEDTETPAG